MKWSWKKEKKMKEKISRRDFLKMGVYSLGGLALLPAGQNKIFKSILPTDGYIPDYSMEEPIAALLDLPILHTMGTPVYVENLTLGHDHINFTHRPKDDPFLPQLLTLDNLPFDILPNRRPAPELIETLGCAPLVPWVADFPHVTGHQPMHMMAVLGYGQPEESLAYKSFDFIERKIDNNIVVSHAFTDKIGIYPSKIYNILTAMICSLEWQQKHGPMTKGRPYSILEYCGATDVNVNRYLMGGYLNAGGICAFVTTTSKVTYLLSQLNYLKVLERHLHKDDLQYAINKLDPALTKLNSDATVGYVATRPFDNPGNSDYRWEMVGDAPELYFSYRAHIECDEKPYEPTSASRHRKQPCDARLTFTISMTKEDPLTNFDELQMLHEVRDRYSEFHNFDDRQHGGFTAETIRD